VTPVIHANEAKSTTGPVKRIIKGRPFAVGFDCSYQRLQEGAPS
jgi:hypothetical protein